MKLEIYKAVPAEEQVVRLRLAYNPRSPGDVVINVVDKDGELRGVLLAIHASVGKISRCPCVSPDLGFSLDGMGRVMILGED